MCYFTWKLVSDILWLTVGQISLIVLNHRYANYVSDVLTENSSSHWPDLSLVQDEVVQGSCESLRRRYPLNFDDLKTAANFLTWRGQWEARGIKVYVCGRWMRSQPFANISQYFLILIKCCRYRDFVNHQSPKTLKDTEVSKVFKLLKNETCL